MIKMVARFQPRECYDVNYIKIASSAAAYGLTRPFLGLWQTGGTLIMRIDGYVTLFGEDFDPRELKDFLSAIGTKSISCSVGAAEKLGLPYKTFRVLKSGVGSAVAADFEPSTDEVYRLLAFGTDGDITLPPRDAFMADLSHRIRHGTALACTYKGTVCVLPYITEHAALICGVSAGESRGSGFAGMCVAAAVKKADKPCFVICSDALSGFYKRFGFSDAGETAEIVFS